MRSKLPHKKDANHNAIADAFTSVGASVSDTSALGGDFPDMVVGLVGVNILVEVKTADGKLEPGQERFRDEWRGWYEVVRSPEEAIALVMRVRKAVCKR